MSKPNTHKYWSFLLNAGLDEVRDYVEHHDLNVTVVLGGASVARQWQIQAFPSYYVLNSEHKVVRRDIGYSSQLGLWLRAWVI